MLLTVKEAEMELETGAKMNPGPWKQNSISAAINARLIADCLMY